MELPLREPFRISGGALPVRRSLIVEVEGTDGARGWGEAAPFDLPFYSAETVATVEAVVRDVLAPRIIDVPMGHPGFDRIYDLRLWQGDPGFQWLALAGKEPAHVAFT